MHITKTRFLSTPPPQLLNTYKLNFHWRELMKNSRKLVVTQILKLKSFKEIIKWMLTCEVTKSQMVEALRQIILECHREPSGIQLGLMISSWWKSLVEN